VCESVSTLQTPQKDQGISRFSFFTKRETGKSSLVQGLRVVPALRQHVGPAERGVSAVLAEGVRMVGRMVGLVAGSLTGMALGAVLVAAVCAGLERYAGARFGKEPLVLMLVLGMPAGGLLGALVGVWSVTDRAKSRGPDDPAEPGGSPDRRPPS